MTESRLNRQRLKIGKIPYANLFPIFYMLENRCDTSKYEFIEGVPSSLNRMLRNGEVDISPSSSIEYLSCRDKYDIVEGHSISSFGPIESIILFSKKKVEQLDGLTVLTSSQSETSVALLRIIFEKFYKVKCNLRTADIRPDALPSDAEAYLQIGDDALKTVISYKLKVKREGKTSQSSTLNSQLVRTYDLGEIWYKYTSLPFTFALWIHRKECCRERAGLLKKFKEDLSKAKEFAVKSFKELASASPLRGVLTEDELIGYWEKISYDFGDEHKKGLELFRKYSEELGLIE